MTAALLAALLALCGLSVTLLGLHRRQRRLQCRLSVTETALATARVELKQAQGARKAFLGAVSHELRTPLQAVLGMAEVLAQSPMQAGQRRDLQVLQRAALRLRLMLGDLLDLAQLQAGGMLLAETPFDPRALLRTVIADWSEAQEAGRAPIALECDSALPEALMGDSGRLQRLLAILLEHTLGTGATVPGTLRLHAERQPGERWQLELSLRAGPGHRGAESAGRDGPEPELAYARALAQAMSGSLQCLEPAGEGPGWRLRLVLSGAVAPRSAEGGGGPDPGAGDPGAAADDGPVDSGPLRLLLVEDSADNRLILRHFLGSRNWCARPWVLEEAVDGLEGVERFRAAHYDLVIMDLQMPRMNGLEATAALREWERRAGRPPVPVLMLTASTGPDEVASSLAAGASAHLSKPISQGALLSALGQHLQLSESGPVPE